MLGQGQELPVCKWCGTRLVFRGQTTCQSCGSSQTAETDPRPRSAGAWEPPVAGTGSYSWGEQPIAPAQPRWGVPPPPTGQWTAPPPPPVQPNWGVPPAQPARPSWGTAPVPGTWARTPYARPATGRRIRSVAILAAALVAAGCVIAAAAYFGAAPQHPRFAATGVMTELREGHTATLLGDGRVLIVGGDDGTNALATAELYDPDTETFSRTGPLRIARTGHTATLLPDGKVLVVGGWPKAGDSEPLSSAEVYDPTTGTFGDTGLLPSAWASAVAAPLQDGKVLIVTGWKSSDYFSTTAAVYDSATGQFTEIAVPYFVDRGAATATPLHDGRVLIYGGWGFNDPTLSTAAVYDPASGFFDTAASSHDPRAYNATALLHDGRVLVAGGAASSATYADVEDTAEVFDPATNKFTPTGSMSSPRDYVTAVTLSDGRVLVAGGYDGTGNLSSSDIYDPDLGTFSPGPHLDAERSSYTATLLDDGRVLLAGGESNGWETDTAILYEP
jgi:large repetitive protein